jgi:hypothetical protein
VRALRAVGRGLRTLSIYALIVAGGLAVLIGVIAAFAAYQSWVDRPRDSAPTASGSTASDSSPSSEAASSGGELDIYRKQVIEAYCSYAPVSQAQYRGCIEHVSVGDILALNTPAAKHALAGIPQAP